jgi:hypothetical protein
MLLPGVLERARMRLRLREQRRVRDALLLDLGALVYELHRHGKRAPELLQQKAAELTVIDEDVRYLEESLGGEPREWGAIGEPEADVADAPVDMQPEADAAPPEADAAPPEPAFREERM